ncbi:hypothetical protein AGMMS50268_34480 [Spirochaetia bacterium]|nr:hypothetical protein AGMMS50268_34480 [Spirochaetia bacterium]
MGTVYAEITLTNTGDRIDLRKGLITEAQVRKVTVQSVVDTGAATLFISEAVCGELGLEIEGERHTRIANGGRIPCKVTEPVGIRWKERDTACRAIVMPGLETVLLGAIPLEDMDLMVNPVGQELVGVHGDEVVALALVSAEN